MRILDVLAAVAQCEHDDARRASLSRHARLVLDQARRSIVLGVDFEDLRQRYVAFVEAAGTRTQPKARVEA